MNYCIVTGKIYFLSIPSYDEMTDISLFLLEKAINNKIHINLNINLTGKALDKYPIRDYIKEGYVPYEILDTAWSGVCQIIKEAPNPMHTIPTLSLKIIK